MGFKGTALNWLKSYFSDRFQFVQINDDAMIASNETVRKSGVIFDCHWNKSLGS